MKFDDAEHYFLDFEAPLPNEAGGIPSGLYLVWAAGSGLVPEALAQDIRARRERGQTCAGILFDVADGKLTAQEFNEEGRDFTAAFYEASYLADYARCFGIVDATNDALCSVPDTPASLARLKPYLHERLVKWRATPKASAPVIARLDAEGLRAWLRERLVPLLVADGYEMIDAGRRFDFLARRQRGPIEQFVIYTTHDNRDRKGWASLTMRLGAERLRKVWLRLLDRAPDAPLPAAFTVSAQHHPEVSADDLSLTPEHKGYEQYWPRFPEATPACSGEVVVAHYLEQVRPRLAMIDSVTALAEQVDYPGQAIRLSNHQGALQGPEVLARAVLLASYGDRLSGHRGEELVEQLRVQIRRNIQPAADGFPTVADLDALIAVLRNPGTIERVRTYLDA